MTQTPEDTLAGLAYDAALRGQAVVGRSVEALRSHVIFVVTGGSVAIGFFANAALKAPSAKDGWIIASAASTGLFLIGAMVTLRLRKGIAREIDPGSLLKLAHSDAASVRLAVARRIAASTKASNAVLQLAQRELYGVIGLLAVSLTFWVVATVTGQP